MGLEGTFLRGWAHFEGKRPEGQASEGDSFEGNCLRGTTLKKNSERRGADNVTFVGTVPELDPTESGGAGETPAASGEFFGAASSQRVLEPAVWRPRAGGS